MKHQQKFQKYLHNHLLFSSKQMIKIKMQRFILLIIIHFMFICKVHCQINANYHYKDIHKNIQQLDSLLRNQEPFLEENYFVITYSTLSAVSSFGMQLYKAYHSVKNKNTKIVLLLSNEGGVRPKDIQALLKRILKINDADLKKILIITNKDIYNYVLQEKHLVRLLYVYRRNVYYDENQKLHTLNKVLPAPKMNMVSESGVELQGIDSFFLKQGDRLFPYKKDHLLILGDITNVLYDINLKTGVVAPLLDLRKYVTPYDVYTSEIVNWDTAKSNFAKKYNKDLVKKNRQTLQLNQVKFQNELFYGVFSIEVMELNDKNYKYVSDEGDSVNIAKGKPVLSNYLFFFTWDPAKKELSSITRIKNPVEDKIYTNADCGFYFSEDTLFTAVTRYFAPEREVGHIGLYKRMNGEIHFNQFIGPLTKVENEYDYYHTKDFFTKFNKKLLYCYNYLGEICEVGQERKMGQLVGNGEAPYEIEQLRKVSESTVHSKLNYDIHAVESVFNDLYLLFFYQYKDDFLFELKNTALRTVDVINATRITDLKEYLNNAQVINNLTICNDKIYYLALNDKGMYLKTLKINFMEAQ
jgi:hypothetical protein